MNSLIKRFGAGLMALVLVLSLFVGALPTDVFAQTGTLVKNTEARHNYDDVELSDQALAYYTGEYTWEKLSALEGGNEDCLDMDNPMFKALHTLMDTTMTNSVSYKSLTDYWPKTDGNILFYSDEVSSSYNREHVWPKSHASFHEKDGGADLHHLRPTNSTINSTRNNNLMCNVREKFSSYSTKEYNGKIVLWYVGQEYVEVADNIKGDVARILLYVWCRWEEPNLYKKAPNPVLSSGDEKNDGKPVIESLETLLEWCEIDPVDTWEMERNDQVENVQGNRNVFIDYPEFAWLIFGQDVPEDYDTPSGNGGTASNPECTVHNYVATVTAPTCVAVGYTTYKCSRCGYSYTANTVAATGHKWVVATCTVPKTCSVCKVTEGAAAGHKDTDSNNACDVCGTAMGTPTPPVVTESGYYLITSKDQFTTGQYVMIADKGYAPGALSSGWLPAVKPTVSGDQVTDTKNAVWTLTVDGDSVTLKDSNGVTVKPKSGNDNGIQSGAYNWTWEFNDGTFKFKGIGSDTTTLASNVGSSNGFRAYKNTTVSGNPNGYPSNFKLYKFIEKTCNHAYSGVVTVAPTCTTAGVKTFTCSKCGDNYTETIAALGHTKAEPVVENEKAPTCVEAGSYESVVYCSVCKAELSRETIPGDPSTGVHTYDNDQDADCNVCGAEREIEPAECEHAWDDGVETIPAGRDTKGERTYTCGKCGETKKEEIPALLRFASWNVTLKNNIQVNFIGHAANLTTDGYTDMYAVITIESKTEGVTTKVTVYQKDCEIDSQGRPVFSFTELAPDMLSNKITATLYAKHNGREYVSAVIEKDVTGYVDSQLEKLAGATTEKDKKLRTLMVDLLNYATAVQEQSGYKKYPAINSVLTETEKSWASNQEVTAVKDTNLPKTPFEGELLVWKTASLSLGDAVIPYFKFECADLTGITIEVECAGSKYEYACDLAEEWLEWSASDSRYRFNFIDLGVTRMREPIYLTAYKDGVAVSHTLTYSVQSYCDGKLTAGTTLNDVCIAMLKYGDAAKAYVNCPGN